MPLGVQASFSVMGRTDNTASSFQFPQRLTELDVDGNDTRVLARPKSRSEFAAGKWYGVDSSSYLTTGVVPGPADGYPENSGFFMNRDRVYVREQRVGSSSSSMRTVAIWIGGTGLLKRSSLFLTNTCRTVITNSSGTWSAPQGTYDTNSMWPPTGGAGLLSGTGPGAVAFETERWSEYFRDLVARLIQTGV